MRSLRARLVAVTAIVAVTAVSVGALMSRQVVTTEYQRLERLAGPVSLERAVRALATWRAAGGAWSGADSLLAAEGRAIARTLVVVGERGAVLAASAPAFRDAHVIAQGSGAYRIELGGPAGSQARAAAVLELVEPPRQALAGADSGAVLVALPPGEPAGDGPAAAGPPGVRALPTLRILERGLWAGALAAFAIGGLLVWLLSARLLGPVEALTAAARRMAAGDLTPRVTPRGDDEVAALARSFNTMAGTLAEARTARRRLTRDVAHELRTPLTALRGQVEAIEDGLLRPDPPTLRSLRDEIVHLSRLVEDLDRLAEAEDGALRLEPADVPAREALEAAAASFAAAAAAGEVAIEVHAPGECIVRADPLRLGQIVRNLVANALAHTPAGGRVALSAQDGGARVAIVVADTGAGIAPGHLPHVFERFYRTDSARSRTAGGSGLGLAIVKHLAEAMGGAVRAESVPGRGATFTVELPAAGARGAA